MLKEALEFLRRGFQMEANAQVIEVPGDKRTVRLRLGETVTEINRDHPTVKRQALTLESFARTFVHYKVDSDSRDDADWHPTVWVSEKQLIGRFSGDPFDLDRVIMSLKPTHLFEAVQQIPHVHPGVEEHRIREVTTLDLIPILPGEPVPLEDRTGELRRRVEGGQVRDQQVRRLREWRRKR